MNHMDGDDRAVPHHEVVVVGGGQAGLAASWWLAKRGVEHVVLERHSVGYAWREQRWDSFCLVTPNWQCSLPGWQYAGDDPDGFMLKDQIVDYMTGFAASFDAPVIEGVDVTSLGACSDGDGFQLATSAGPMRAAAVIVATGGYHTPVIPRLAERLPDGVVQVTPDRYGGPDQLPDGEVLVVGTGQSGAQIAEDLHLAGRRVHLAVGRAPRVARSYRGRDVVAWLHDMGHYDVPVTEHPLGTAAATERTNHYVTGRDGGHDIDLRAFARDGMHLYGRLDGLRDGQLHFDDDLAANLDGADAVSESIKDTIDGWIDKHGWTDPSGAPAPTQARYVPVWVPPADSPRTLDVGRVSTVVWCTGFRRDHSWVHLPAFDGRGQMVHHRGVTGVKGLYVIGLPWLHTWGSGRFAGVSRDAEYLSEIITGR